MQRIDAKPLGRCVVADAAPGSRPPGALIGSCGRRVTGVGQCRGERLAVFSRLDLALFFVQIDIDLGVGVDKLDGLGDNADAVAAAQGIDGWAGRLSPGTA